MIKIRRRYDAAVMSFYINGECNICNCNFEILPENNKEGILFADEKFFEIICDDCSGMLNKFNPIKSEND